MEWAIVMSQFQQAILHLQRKLRKSDDQNIMGTMIDIIFAQDAYEVDQDGVQELAQLFDLDKETAGILQIMFSSFEKSGFPEVEDYMNLLLYRIDSGICLLEQHSSQNSSPLQFYSSYQVNEHVEREIVKKSIKKNKKKQTKKKRE